MKLTRLAAAQVLYSLTPEEQKYAKTRQAEILAAGGQLDEAIRVPMEEIAAARAKDGTA